MKISHFSFDRLRQNTSLQLQLLASHSSAMLLGAGLVLIANQIYETHFGTVLELLFAGLLSLVFMSASSGRIIVQPLKKLNQSIQAFAAGDLQVRSLPGDSPELRQLSSSFNYLAESLQGVEQRRQEVIDDLLHEIRTPVTIIHANLKLLQNQYANQIGQPLNWMLKETERLKRLSEDAYNLSSFEDGCLPIRFEAFAVRPLLKEVVLLVATQPKSCCQVLLDCPAQSPKVYADPLRVKQILINLVDNAMAHTPQGTVTVRAWVESNCLWLAVLDTGMGIEAADLPHVFDRFWRSEHSRQINPEGRGLGLSITKRLVELQGGRIEVESEVDKGTMFYFSLQLA